MHIKCLAKPNTGQAFKNCYLVVISKTEQSRCSSIVKGLKSLFAETMRGSLDTRRLLYKVEVEETLFEREVRS